VLISKIIFLKLKNKYYFDVFLNEKYFEKQLLPHSQSPPDSISASGFGRMDSTSNQKYM
jgi:hypothetical protein